MISEQTVVVNVLNNYNVNVIKNMGQPLLLDVIEDIENVFRVHEFHESVQHIKRYMNDQHLHLFFLMS